MDWRYYGELVLVCDGGGVLWLVGVERRKRRQALMGAETDEVGERLHSTTDAEVWAQEFAALFGGVLVRHEGAPTSIYAECEPGGIIHSWFANAIECGRSHGIADMERAEYNRGHRDGWNAARHAARAAYRAVGPPDHALVLLITHVLAEDLGKRAVANEEGGPAPTVTGMAQHIAQEVKQYQEGEQDTEKPFWEEYRNPGEIHQRLRGAHDCGEECPWYGMSDPSCQLRCLDCGYVGDRVFIQRTAGGPWRDALHPHVILMRGNHVCSLCGSDRLQLVVQHTEAPSVANLPFRNLQTHNEGDKVTVTHAGLQVTMQITEALWQSDGSVRLTCRWPDEKPS